MSNQHGMGPFFNVFKKNKQSQAEASFSELELKSTRQPEAANLLKIVREESGVDQVEFIEKFGVLFPPANEVLFSEEELKKLAELMFENDCADNNTNVPVGLAFFGQFIDHDITLDATTKLGRVAGDASQVENFRTPRLDLDSIYLNGPEPNPYLYEKKKFGHGPEMLIGTACNPHDVQRLPDGTAIIGDPRNDENIFISQMQSLFIRFHNYVVEQIKRCPGHQEESVFERARNICRWVYQWIVVNEFLPAVVDEEILRPYIDGFNNGTLPVAGKINWHSSPIISLEFSAAAYRFGHSLIRQNYRLNDIVSGDLFTFPPFSPVGEYRTIDWKYLLNFGDGNYLPAKAIDTVLPQALKNLPFIGDGIPNLAARNMIRGQLTFLLPSGETVAKELGGTPIEKHPLIQQCGLEQTPLWFYVLAEAEAAGGKLGQVGGQIVAGTLLRLILADETSYINSEEAGDFNPHEVLGVAPDNICSVFAEMARKVSNTL